MGEEDDAGMKFTSKLFLKMKTRCRNKGDTLPSYTVTSTDLHFGGGGGTVANKHSGAGGGHRNTKYNRNATNHQVTNHLKTTQFQLAHPGNTEVNVP